jgi:hypothetical protein
LIKIFDQNNFPYFQKSGSNFRIFLFFRGFKMKLSCASLLKKKVFVQVAKNPKTLDLIIGISQLAKQRTRNRSEKNVSSSFAI